MLVYLSHSPAAFRCCGFAAAWARRARDIDRLLPGAQHSLAACSRKCEQCRVYRLAVAVNVAAASATLCCAPTEDEKSKEARGETTEDAVTTSAHGTECLGQPRAIL